MSSSKRPAQAARQARVAATEPTEEYSEVDAFNSELVQSLAKAHAAPILSLIGRVLADEGVFSWMEENGKTKSELMAKIFDAQATVSTAAAPKKKKDAPTVSLEVLDRTIHNFKDGYKPGGCLMSIKHAIVEGRDPFTLCGAKASGGVCAECLKKKSGRDLSKEVGKRGFDVKVYRGINAAAAARWAGNKQKTMQTKVANEKLRTIADSSSDAEDEAPAPDATDAEEWSVYDFNNDLDFHNKYGLVAEVHGVNEHRVIGIDFDLNGVISKLTPSQTAKYEDLGFIVLIDAVEEEKKPAASQRPARTPAKPATPPVTEPETEI